MNASVSAPAFEHRGNKLAGIDLLLSRLNPEQREAALHGLNGETPGPLLVIAGAGSGKTNTLGASGGLSHRFRR